MAKSKNKKRVSAEKIHAKKDKLNTAKSLNPFEVHINKEKLRIIGKKQKNAKGLPGVSRGKAVDKRKRTLLQEYKIQNKSNQFMDKRIGEKNHGMSDEDKIMARFTAIRVRANKRKNIFNLADDEILTHKGQTLNEIDKFDDPRSDDEDSEEEGKTGNLDKDFVEEAHFGGGMLRKTGVEGAKSHKDLIDQLIANSKKNKAERQKNKEVTLELTEKLDTDWKDLIPLVNEKNKVEDNNRDKQKIDDYDRIMRELRFECRGTVSDKLKTEDEIAKEEKERLEMLELERLERMRGFMNENQNTSKHRSADDLDDDIVYEEVSENFLSYDNEGKSHMQVEAKLNGKDIKVNNELSDNSENDISESEESSAEELEAESGDNLSDLKQSSSDSDEDIDEHKQNEGKIVNIENRTPEIKLDLLKKKEVMEQACKELPFTYDLPESYETLHTLLSNQTSQQQTIIIERMIKCNHPSLKEGNKDNLGLLFAYLLQFLNDLFFEASLDNIHTSYDTFKALVPQFFELAQLNPENTHNSMLEVIKEKHEEYRKNPKQYPGLEVLVFFKLVSVLFTTSDFRHQVVTPCFIFMEQILSRCWVRTRKDVSYGFYLSALVLEYTVISKRYLPAVINFLSGVLHMTIPKCGVKLLRVMSPFKSNSTLLVLLENYSLETFDSLKMHIDDLVKKEVDEQFKVRILYNTIKIIQEYYNNFIALPSNLEIFEPISNYMKMIPMKNYPMMVQKVVENFLDVLENARTERKLEFVVMDKRKPKALRLYEPKIVEIYEGKRFKTQSKEKAEQSKLLHKLKREKKGALREIRRDKSFLGRVKLQQQMRSDKERREKVKRIYAEASLQQCELNELDRKKKRKK